MDSSIRRVCRARRALRHRLGHGRLGLRREAGAGHRTGIGAGDGHGLVRLLARSGGNVLADVLRRLRWRWCLYWCGSVESILRRLGGRVLHADGRRLQLERLWGMGWRLGRRVLRRVVLTILGRRVDVLGLRRGHVRRLGRAREPGGVGRGLRAELREIQVGPGLVTQVHGLAQPLLGVEAVEDDRVDEDDNDVDDDLDDGAHQ